MANPNIVGVTSILGKTTVLDVTTTITNLVSNDTGSNKVFKINSLIIANIDGVNAADITVDLFRSSVSYKLASTITVPADASLVVISKDTSLYLEEGDIIRCQASVNGDLQAICSYEEIS
jgi:hypothetical protein